MTARIIGEGLAAELKQPFVIENRPGAAGTIGVDLVAKSKPDGYTIGLSGVGPTSIIPAIDKNLAYNFERDLEVVAGLSAVDGFIVARADFPHKDIKEMLDYARANPGKVTYGTAGVAGPAQLQAEDLSLRAGVKMLHVPFAGDAPALAAILAGDVDIGFVAVAAGTTFVSSGKMKALAAGGPGRLKSLPDLLTAAEQTGFTGYTAYAWNILVAPKGTPRNIIDKLNKRRKRGRREAGDQAEAGEHRAANVTGRHEIHCGLRRRRNCEEQADHRGYWNQARIAWIEFEAALLRDNECASLWP